MKHKISLNMDLRRNPYKGTYIAIEGIDGSGKTTQVKRLQKYFESAGKKVVVTSEPTEDLSIGKFIREKLLKAKVKIPSSAYQFIYSADRVLNHQKIVEPALKSGKTVLSHRSIWSSPAYGALDLDMAGLNDKIMNRIMIAQGNFSYYHQFLAPDIVFYLDISVDEVLKRIKRRDLGDHDIYQKKNKLEKVQAGYKWLIKKFPKEIIVINGNRPEAEVTESIIRHPGTGFTECSRRTVGACPGSILDALRPPIRRVRLPE